MPQTAVFAITTRGLEEISAEEMASLPGVAVTGGGYRRVLAGVRGDLAPLLGLRTVDDVYLHVAERGGIVRQRTALETLREWGASLSLEAPLECLRTLRCLPTDPRFAITASFVGKRNYSGDEIKVAMAEGVVATTGWRYCSLDREADVSLRLFIEHEQALLGLRMGASPLHRRDYKVAQRPGSLKPSVAAAMLWSVREIEGLGLDPCCGVGTIPIEGVLMGRRMLAGDIDRQALGAARTNGDQVAQVGWLRWDAARLPVESASVGVVVSNLPWGRQVQVDSGLERLYGAIGREIARVLAPGGRAVLLTTFPEWLPADGMAMLSQREISLYGQRPSIVVLRRE